MRIEMKTAVALLSTNLRKALPALLAVLALTSCGAGDDSSSCLFSAPAPRIDSYPPTVATAGHLYGYGVDATYSCWFFPLVSTTCGGITGLRLPAGASAGGTGVSWTPAANQVNTDVNFAISTLPDICGNRATQTCPCTSMRRRSLRVLPQRERLFFRARAPCSPLCSSAPAGSTAVVPPQAVCKSP